MRAGGSGKTARSAIKREPGVKAEPGVTRSRSSSVKAEPGVTPPAAVKDKTCKAKRAQSLACKSEWALCFFRIKSECFCCFLDGRFASASRQESCVGEQQTECEGAALK